MSKLSDFIATGSGGSGNAIVSDPTITTTTTHQVNNIVYGPTIPSEQLPQGTVFIQMST